MPVNAGVRLTCHKAWGWRCTESCSQSICQQVFVSCWQSIQRIGSSLWEPPYMVGEVSQGNMSRAFLWVGFEKAEAGIAPGRSPDHWEALVKEPTQ